MNNIPVCLCCDQNYLRYACVTMASVAYNTKGNVDFILLHKEISQGNQEIVRSWLHRMFPNCSVHFIDIKEKLSCIRVKQVRHFNELVFARYFIPDLLPDATKAIYLDSDTIALQDISAFNDIDLNGHALGAVYEYWLDNEDWKASIRNDIEYLKLLGSHAYFSSGVLLIDCEKWRKEKICNKLLEIYELYREQTRFPDQDPLNKLFENNYHQLHPTFNATEQVYLSFERSGKEDKLNDIKNHTVIRHFAGDSKPWQRVTFYQFNNKEHSDNFNDWWFFASLTPFINSIENCFLEYRSKFFRINNNIAVQTSVVSSSTPQTVKQKSISFLGIPFYYCRVVPNEQKKITSFFCSLFKIKRKIKNKTIYLLGIPIYYRKLLNDKQLKRTYFACFSIKIEKVLKNKYISFLGIPIFSRKVQ